MAWRHGVASFTARPCGGRKHRFFAAYDPTEYRLVTPPSPWATVVVAVLLYRPSRVQPPKRRLGTRTHRTHPNPLTRLPNPCQLRLTGRHLLSRHLMVVAEGMGTPPFNTIMKCPKRRRTNLAQ